MLKKLILVAAGLVFSVLVVLPLATWLGGTVGAAISVGAVLLGSYPLLLASWA